MPVPQNWFYFRPVPQREAWVKCCFSSRLQDRIWVHSESEGCDNEIRWGKLICIVQSVIGYTDEYFSPFGSCEKGCHGDYDCGADERCNERVWRCVKTRCKEPYKQAKKAITSS